MIWTGCFQISGGGEWFLFGAMMESEQKCCTVGNPDCTKSGWTYMVPVMIWWFCGLSTRLSELRRLWCSCSSLVSWLIVVGMGCLWVRWFYIDFVLSVTMVYCNYLYGSIWINIVVDLIRSNEGSLVLLGRPVILCSVRLKVRFLVPVELSC